MTSPAIYQPQSTQFSHVGPGNTQYPQMGGVAVSCLQPVPNLSGNDSEFPFTLCNPAMSSQGTLV